MTSPNDMAFPLASVFRPDGDLIFSGEFGLTKREYFAAKIAQGMCSMTGWASMEVLVDAAVAQSDALLTALAKRTERGEG